MTASQSHQQFTDETENRTHPEIVTTVTTHSLGGTAVHQHDTVLVHCTSTVISD